MQREWERETRLCATIALRTDVLEAIRAHLEQLELEAAEAHALVCWETTSRRLTKPSLFDRMIGAGHNGLTQGVIVTPARLVWAVATNGDEAFATSEPLVGLEVTDYERGPGFALLPDHGVEVRGVAATEGRAGTLFFGLGEGPDADRARSLLKAAVKAARGEGPPVGET